ncbi:MAG: dienelactone hydrolase family protein [Alkalispirochaeta sp.]
MRDLIRIVMITFMVGVVGSGPVFAQADPAEPAEPNVAYPAADGAELHGYLATPSGDGPSPAVLMIHEWWGLNVDTTRLAEALSAEGYVVLAPDAFRGSVARDAQGAMAQLNSTPQQQIAGDLDAALDFLSTHEAVDSDRIAVMGFCFGGTQAMYMGTRASDLSAVITLYGSGPIQTSDALGNLVENGPVLGIFGAEDRSISLEEVNGFEAVLNEADVPNTITVYEGVGHAFVKSDTYDQGGAAEEAWQQLVGFLNRELTE